MMKKIKVFIYAILAGLCIALGGTVYLTLENKIMGAFLFTLGLFTICTFGFNLFTGKVCYVFERDLDYLVDVGVIWLGNLVGTLVSGWALLATRVGPVLAEKAAVVCATKLGDSLLSIFILAIFCNIMIFIGVDGYNKNPHEAGKYLSMFMAIMVFILCGFEHCIANMFYFTVGGVWGGKALLYLAVMTLGNAVGGLIIPLCRKAFANT
ncbi:MAG: formate/nitrite transporter family protein [Oscillospiraceae bacterium]|nr:formate/nitrite transporter family protein [Oscillospiraceae bacterium]